MQIISPIRYARNLIDLSLFGMGYNSGISICAHLAYRRKPSRWISVPPRPYTHCCITLMKSEDLLFRNLADSVERDISWHGRRIIHAPVDFSSYIVYLSVRR